MDTQRNSIPLSKSYHKRNTALFRRRNREDCTVSILIELLLSVNVIEIMCLSHDLRLFAYSTIPCCIVEPLSYTLYVDVDIDTVIGM